MAVLLFLAAVTLVVGISFVTACLVTWAVCFIAGLFGVTTLVFSWKLAMAVWIILGVLISIFKSCASSSSN